MFCMNIQNIQNIVNDLLKHGFTQQSLATELTGRGCEITQPTIWRIVKSAKYQPRADKAFALASLHAELIKPEIDEGENSPAREVAQ